MNLDFSLPSPAPPTPLITVSPYFREGDLALFSLRVVFVLGQFGEMNSVAVDSDGSLTELSLRPAE